jgi:hypothetical protein
VAANARKDGDVNPAPNAARVAPESFMTLRRSIISFLPLFMFVMANSNPEPP